MKKYFSILFIILFAVTFIISGFTTAVQAAEKGKPVMQTICPVMGDKIDKRYYTDYKGNRIYFCCKSCPEDFKKNPEKYMKKLKDSGVTLEKSPGK